MLMNCPKCKVSVQLLEEHEGKMVRCPSCQEVFQAQSSSPQAIQAEAPRPARLDHFDDEPASPARRRSQFGDNGSIERQTWIGPPDQLPGHSLAIVLVALQIVGMLLGLGSLILLVMQDSMLSDFARGVVDQQRTETNAALQTIVGVVSFLLMVPMLIVFFVWFYRAYQNLERFRLEGLNYTPAWAVGYFFIPILNFFRPYQVMQEIWKGSNPEIPIDDPLAWREEPRSGLVLLWWLTSLIGGFIAGFAGGFIGGLTAGAPNRQPPIDVLILACRIQIVGSILAVIGGILIVVLVLRIRSRQFEKATLASQGM